MKIRNLLRVVVLTGMAGLAFASGKVNINTADAEALATALEGVGASKAEAIVQYRKQHGPFKSVEALLEVKGIGPSVVQANHERMTVDSE